MDHSPVIKAGLEAVSVFTLVGALLGYLPAIAAGFSIAWYIFLFYKAIRKDS